MQRNKLKVIRTLNMISWARRYSRAHSYYCKSVSSFQRIRFTSTAPGKYWTTRPDERVDIRMGTEGNAARPPQTFIDVFRERVREHGDRPAVKCKEKVNGQVCDKWKTWTWKEYWDDCNSFAKSLMKLDIQMHKVVNIIGFNSVSLMINYICYIQ